MEGKEMIAGRMDKEMQAIYRQRSALLEGLRNGNLQMDTDEAIKRLHSANAIITEHEKKVQENLLWD